MVDRNRQEIMEFLNGLKEKLKKSLEVDYQDLKAFQKELSTQSVQKNETGNANKDHQISKSDRSVQEKQNFSNEFEQWDVSYLNYQMKKMKYDVDQEKIREYFPAKTVIKADTGTCAPSVVASLPNVFIDSTATSLVFGLG